MIDLLHAVHHSPNSKIPIRHNTRFRSDLAWWSVFIHSWNEVSFLPSSTLLPRLELSSGASGSWGCRAWHQQYWFQVPWDHRSATLTIAEKELIPIILACTCWGASWAATQVVCHCDNQVIVACLKSRTSKHKGIMHLLRCLVFIEAHFQFILTLRLIIWQMISHATIFLPSCLRFLEHAVTRHQFHFLSWAFCWTPERTGPHAFGTVSSTVFSGRTSPIYPEIISHRNETFW